VPSTASNQSSYQRPAIYDQLSALVAHAHNPPPYRPLLTPVRLSQTRAAANDLYSSLAEQPRVSLVELAQKHVTSLGRDVISPRTDARAFADTPRRAGSCDANVHIPGNTSNCQSRKYAEEYYSLTQSDCGYDNYDSVQTVNATCVIAVVYLVYTVRK